MMFFACTDCGSHNMAYDAKATWDFKTQDWLIDDVELGGRCKFCREYGDGVQMEYDPDDGTVSFVDEEFWLEEEPDLLAKVKAPTLDL